MSAAQVLARRLSEAQEAGLARRLVEVGPGGGPRQGVNGRDCLLMASNDYLGLSQHPRLIAAARAAAEAEGTGSGASRLVTGSRASHRALEAQIAAFKQSQAALFFCTGYMANLGLLSSLAGLGDLIVSDRLNHASLIDGCRLSRAAVAVYPHGEAKEAERLLAAPCPGLKLLVTDGVFSMDGDLAPLPELLAAARRQGALLVVDDAHATGVWGQGGRGSLEHWGIEPGREVVMMGTFSKALGGLGGYVAASRLVIECLLNRARSFIYTTAPPPAQVAAASAALALLVEEPWRCQELRRKCDLLRRLLARRGLSVLSSAGPILPLLVGGAQKALDLAQALWRQGVYAPAMRPPTVPRGQSRLRLTVTAAHSQADLEFAANALGKAAKEVGL